MKKQKNIEPIKQVSNRKYYYLLGLITFFVFANSIGNDYNMDDTIVTRGHQLTSQGLSAIGEIFTSNYYSDAMGYAFGYRPMVHLSFALEHELFGEKPGVGHLINVLLFAFSVVLFFKLMVKWVGQKNILFAGIASLLFALHPVHTEVVDSLKNRDELLAFFFIIWSGLSVHRYLERGKWTSIFSIALLFSLAMLSKKSVYPMAIVLPAAIILLKNLSIKQISFIALAFVIPAAVIGSELNFSRMGIMISLPLIGLAILNFIKGKYLSDSAKPVEFGEIKRLLLPLAITLIISIIAVFTSSAIVLFFTLPFFIWLFKIQLKAGLISMIFFSISIDFIWLGNKELQLLILLLGFGYSFYLFINTKKLNLFWVGVGLVTILYFYYNNSGVGSVVNIIWISLFVLGTNFRSWLGMLLAITTVLVTYYLKGEIHLFSLCAFFVSFFWFIYNRTKKPMWLQYAPVLVLFITLGFVGLKEYNFKNKHVVESVVDKQSIEKEFVKNDNILKEGRQLEYVENTLVAPHTTEEKIGTGFATLGEYFRLMTFPYELSFYYGFAKTDSTSLKNVWVWLIILIHLGMIFLAFFHVKKNPLITIGVFWYLLSIVLFSNWVELVAGMVGERLAFTASAGFCILVTGMLFWIKPDLNFKKPGVIGFSLIGIMVLFAGRTIVRNTDWKNNLTLMGNDIEHLNNSSQANNMYAMNLMAETNINKSLTQQQVLDMRKLAILHFEKAVEIYPDYYNVYIDMARVALLTEDYQVGIEAVEKAIEIDPENQYSYYFSLSLLERSGDFETYLKHAKKLFELNENQESYGGFARGYFLLKEYQKSKDILLEGLKKYPDNEGLKHNLKFVEERLAN